MPDGIEDIWAADTLGRKADADFLISFLLGRIQQRGKQGLPRSYVLNVDAGWGGGKTFFMTRLAKELVDRDFIVAEIDAWQDDHAEDPLLSLMSAIEKTLDPLVRKQRILQSTYKSAKQAGLAIASAGIRGALKQGARMFIGEAVETIAEEFDVLKERISGTNQEDAASSLDKAIDKSGEKLLAGFEDGKKSISDFKSQMGNLISIIRQSQPEWTLFILIDELDRCRPTYAISLLERIKHLFNVDNVVFVIATDTMQLSHSVRAVYGGGFDGKKYLTRFFDRTYQFPTASLENFVRTALLNFNIPADKLSLPPGISLDKLFIASLLSFSATPREIKRSIETFSDILDAWSQKAKMECVILIPLIVSYHSMNMDLMSEDCLSKCGEFLYTNDNFQCLALFNNRASFNRETRDMPVSRLYRNLLSEMTDIYKASFKDTTDPAAIWVSMRFNEEFQSVHSSSIEHGRVVASIMRGYPQLIATAGRLHSGG